MAEQVWDHRPPAGTGPDTVPGENTRSATPLAWTHAQFVRLARSIDAGSPVETPPRRGLPVPHDDLPVTSAEAARWQVRALRAGDHDRWRELYAGYAAFYRLEQTAEQAERVWGWLTDPGHELQGLVAHGADGHVVGLAHVRAFVRPSTATVGGYLDDLYVDPAARGTGAVDALLAALARLAGERGWSVVRWITADDNSRARGAYDRHATATRWVTYDMAPPPA